jgi:hypothetical protein
MPRPMPRRTLGHPNRVALLVLLAALSAGSHAAPAPASAPAAVAGATPVWDRANLVAWCIVPYDAKKRDAPARAAMLQKLQLRRLAYDWRAEHVPHFDAEVVAMQRAGIEFTAWWFPQKLDANAQKILEVIARHGIRPQLWVTGSGALTKTDAEHAARLDTEAARLQPIVAAAAKLGCTVGLYNHGGWFGTPENQLALLARLRRDGATNVGLVYNFHHGHDDLARFAELWPRLAPHTLAVNINGMKRGADKSGEKILTVGAGDEELGLLRIIDASGWRGAVGILNHRTEVDAEVGLAGNLAGLDRLVAQLRAAR